MPRYSPLELVREAAREHLRSWSAAQAGAPLKTSYGVLVIER